MKNVVQIEDSPLARELALTEARLRRVENSLRALCAFTIAFTVLGLLLGGPARVAARESVTALETGAATLKAIARPR
jgi:hypothetical protein